MPYCYFLSHEKTRGDWEIENNRIRYIYNAIEYRYLYVYRGMHTCFRATTPCTFEDREKSLGRALRELAAPGPQSPASLQPNALGDTALLCSW